MLYPVLNILTRYFFSVKCPAGTFHNSTAKVCQSCPFGQYQNVTASMKCKPCPERTFTKRMHAKSLKDCIRKTLIGFNVLYIFIFLRNKYIVYTLR